MTSEHGIQRALHGISCHFLIGKNGMKLAEEVAHHFGGFVARSKKVGVNDNE